MIAPKLIFSRCGGMTDLLVVWVILLLFNILDLFMASGSPVDSGGAAP
jgi:hypothetical protein